MMGSANRLGEMEVFVLAVEQGSFSAAARACGKTASAVSKLVSRLERRLGARLVNRSTRRLEPTAEGKAYYEGALRLLADVDEIERMAASGSHPSGRVRINSSVSYVNHILAPLIPTFLDQYPDVSLDIAQTDAVVDILADQTDIAVRAGPMPDSNLMARPLGSSRFVVVASPDWLARHEKPAAVADLAGVDGIGFGYRRTVDGWPFNVEGRRVEIPSPDRVRISDGEGIRQLAIAGAGVARLAAFTVRDDLQAGRLVELLENTNLGDVEHFHAVFVGRSETLPARARAFLDFLAEHGTVR
jgi:DNA-binding transcriptional LysR family regulator